jgi:hypothetical protein
VGWFGGFDDFVTTADGLRHYHRAAASVSNDGSLATNTGKATALRCAVLSLSLLQDRSNTHPTRTWIQGSDLPRAGQALFPPPEADDAKDQPPSEEGQGAPVVVVAAGRR